MGCSSGKPDTGLEEELANLKLLLEDTKTRSVEQQNLLRFKVEVLVNMLAMEEKKSDTTNKRLETLKWLMHSQGVSEQRLTEILVKAGEDPEDGSSSSGNKSVALFDLGGAIARMKEDFELYREDILDALAEKDGKLVANLTAEEFAKQLFVVTDRVSKSDISVLSMRFSDGSGNVSIPEFLEFFTTPGTIRAAKAATAAVRMSLDLLQLNGKEDIDGDSESEGEMEMDKDGKPVKRIKSPEELREEHLIIRSHRTATLESGVKKLLDLWPIVHEELDLAFTLFEETTEGGVIVTTEVYKKTLTDICGKKSVILRQAIMDAKENKRPANSHPVVDTVTAKNAAAWGKPPLDTSKSSTSVGGAGGSRPGSAMEGVASNPTSGKAGEAAPAAPAPIVPLDEGDIDLLSERFELAGYVHFGHFMQYFRDLQHSEELALKAALKGKRSTHRLPRDMSGISPFRLSSEWISLRKSAEVSSVALPPPAPAASPAPPAPMEKAKSDKSVKAPPPAAPVEKKEPPAAKPPTPTVAETKEPEKKQPEKPKEAKEAKDAPAAPPAPAPAAPAAPPAGVEEVKSSGCCGGGKKPSPAAPAELPPPAAEEKKQPEELKIDTKEQDSEDEDELKVKKDTKFDTPKGIKKAGFKPKLIEEPAASPSPEPEAPSHGSRFHRRADRTFENEKPKNPLDEDEEEETLYKPKDKNRYK